MTEPSFLYFFNDRNHFRRFLRCLTVLALLSGAGIVFIPQAWAITFTCNADGTVANGNLFEADTLTSQVNDQNGAAATIQPSQNAAGPAADPVNNQCNNQNLGIAGQVLCFFKSTVGGSLSSMYCGLQAEMLQPLSTAMELAIVLLGVAVMTGMTNLTVKDSVTALAKMALVWTFATNATWGIGIAYSLFMGLAEQGSALILSAVSGQANITAGAGQAGAAGINALTAGGAYMTMPDSIINGMFYEVTTGNPSPSNLVLPSSLINDNKVCGLWLISLFIIFMVFVPLVAGFIITLVFQYAMLYARAILGYLTALVLISFLFILSPIFISFALFQITRPLFEQWLKYLLSFSLQMIIVFGFLVMLSLIPIGAFFTEIFNLLRTQDYTIKFDTLPITFTICTFCNVNVDTTALLTANPPPITCAAPDPNNPTLDTLNPFQLMLKPELVEMIVSQVVALWLISSIMKDFLSQAPQFASDLTGRLPFAAMLGASPAALGGAGAIEYIGLDSLEGEISTIPQRLQNFQRQSNWKRFAPAIAVTTVVATAIGSIKRNTDAKMIGGNAAAGGQAAAKSAGSLSQAYSGGLGSGGAGAAGVARPVLGANQIQSYVETQINTTLAQQEVDENYSQVQEALREMERYKTSAIDEPKELHRLTSQLKNTNDALLISSASLYDNQKKMKSLYSSQSALLKTRLGIQPVNARNIKGQTANAADAGSSDSQGSVMIPDTVDTRTGPNLDHMRSQMDASVQALELQMSVQEHLLPADRVRYARSILDKAANDLSYAQTAQSLEDIRSQLYSVQQALA